MLPSEAYVSEPEQFIKFGLKFGLQIEGILEKICPKNHQINNLTALATLIDSMDKNIELPITIKKIFKN